MAEKHYYEQIKFTETYLFSHLEKYIGDLSKLKFLEVGCAEGGFIKTLTDKGVYARGIELLEHRIEHGKNKERNLSIAQGDITDPDLINKLGEKFDVIVMRDVIEHVPDRDAAFKNLYGLLNDNGYMFMAFPPRFSAFAGHQQNGRTVLKFVPYLHYLPAFMIKYLGSMLNEKKGLIDAVIENYEIGITINKYEKLLKKYNFKIVQQDLFLSRPIYKIRFGFNTVRFPNIPVVREVFALGCESITKKG